MLREVKVTWLLSQQYTCTSVFLLHFSLRIHFFPHLALLGVKVSKKMLPKLRVRTSLLISYIPLLLLWKLLAEAGLSGIQCQLYKLIDDTLGEVTDG